MTTPVIVFVYVYHSNLFTPFKISCIKFTFIFSTSLIHKIPYLRHHYVTVYVCYSPILFTPFKITCTFKFTFTFSAYLIHKSHSYAIIIHLKRFISPLSFITSLTWKCCNFLISVKQICYVNKRLITIRQTRYIRP